MKMTTEEAFVKVLQMHGIEHAFGIIGSAMMPISDLFPQAGITFWDAAHECNAGMMADGFTRATGKMSMMVAQNGPGITNFVTPVKTAYGIIRLCFWSPRKPPTKHLVKAGFKKLNRWPFLKTWLLSRRSARPIPHCRDIEPCYSASQACVGTSPDQCSPRFLDTSH